MARPLGPVPEHGTRQRYQLRGNPCHCTKCCAANNHYVAGQRLARRHGVRSRRGCPHTDIVEGSHGQFCTACLAPVTLTGLAPKLPAELMIKCTHSLQDGRASCAWCGEQLQVAS